MKIDLFNHFFPKRFTDLYVKTGVVGLDIGKRVSNIPTLTDLDARFRVMDEFGDYRQVLSMPAPPLEVIAAPDKSPELARVANDGLAELVVKHPDRFPGFVAALPMNNTAAAVEEIEEFKVNASFRNGVLTMSVRAQRQAKRIAIYTG